MISDGFTPTPLSLPELQVQGSFATALLQEALHKSRRADLNLQGPIWEVVITELCELEKIQAQKRKQV